MDGQLVLGDAGGERDLDAHRVHALSDRVHVVVVVCRVVGGRAAAQLHRAGDHARALDRQLDHGRGSRHRRVDRGAIARLADPAQVARRGVVDHRGAGIERAAGIDHVRQFAVFDFDRLERIEAGGDRIGHHHRHRLADEAHAAVSEGAARRHPRRLAVGAFERQHAHHLDHAGGLAVLGGEHAVHAGHRLRGVCPDRHDLRMCAIAAQEHCVQFPGERPVGSVETVAGHQAPVFLALERGVGRVRVIGHVRARPESTGSRIITQSGRFARCVPCCSGYFARSRSCFGIGMSPWPSKRSRVPSAFARPTSR